jgi:hypothetical protein
MWERAWLRVLVSFSNKDFEGDIGGRFGIVREI